MTELPPPDADALAHSARLRQRLRERIRQGGLLSFAQYMQHVLYEPGLGYYMAGASRFGETGDFMTAPESTPLFGAALANEVRTVLEQTGGSILELGAGSGRLALQLLTTLSHSRPVDYHILELSADLIRQQQDLLRSHLPPARFDRVYWHTRLPASFRGVMLANEVMDALPVERFEKRHGQILQIAVTEELQPVSRSAPKALQRAVAAIERDIEREFDEGYISEVCLQLRPWLNGLAHCLEQGVLMLIDYGYPRREYYLPERQQGTLACHYRHRTHDDAFRWPGLQDITAHVDFTAVAETGTTQGLHLLGYASQSAFLLDNGLLRLAEEAADSSTRDRDHISVMNAVRALTLPGQMGERFQVIALGRGYDLHLHGFRTQDLSYRL